jgi:hypothetical protein
MYAYVDGNRCTHEGNEGNMEKKKITVTSGLIAIYAPMIYTALALCFGCVHTLHIHYEGKWGGGPWKSRVLWDQHRLLLSRYVQMHLRPLWCRHVHYRRAQLVSDFIEASRNFFSLKRQPKFFENYQRSFKKYCFAF